MNESANGNSVTEVKEEVPARQQLREFDFKFLQQLPDLSKEVMQHLIEHPEELQARLRYYGLEDVARTSPQSLLLYHDSEKKFTWANFYGDVFGVAPDFSRVRVPQHDTLFTYVTPIFVATKLPLERIISAIQGYGVKLHSTFCEFGNVRDIGRPEDNYIASFSEYIAEDFPRPPFKDEEKYRGTHMTFREYLLWLTYCLYCCGPADKPIHSSIDGRLQRCFGAQPLLGTKICDMKRRALLMAQPPANPELNNRMTDSPTSPHVLFRNEGYEDQMVLHISVFAPSVNFGRYKPSDGVRRVKLFKPLPQI